MHIGITEIVLIAVIAIVLIKPEKLSEYMKIFFQTKATIQKTKAEVDKEMKDLKSGVEDMENAALNNTKEEIS